jgi:spore coat polysaccharide biosynthesis protein SpsF
VLEDKGKAMKTVAVIQARMGSTRLPRKAMMPLAGEPLTFHVIQRALAIRRADEVVLAVPDTPADEQLVELARTLGVRAVRGSEEDVLSRFRLALEGTGADIVVRICADAPLFDPEHVDRAVDALIEHDADLVRWEPPAQTAYQGAGVISKRALDWTWDTARDDPLAFEHVTAYARRHAGELKTVPIRPEPEMIGDFHLSIDTAADLAAMQQVYERLYRPGRIVPLRDAVDLIRRGVVVFPARTGVRP